MNATILAVTAQLALITYYQIVQSIDLFPWNNLKIGSSLDEFNLILGFIQLVILMGSFKKKYWIVKAGLIFYFIWLVLQISNWWIPYIFGASYEIQELYKLYYLETYKFLQPFEGHFVPDANHIVLQIFILINFILCARIVYKRSEIKNLLISSV